jgi:putative tryptophan/tyrosine transport system substrate-binding protein
MGNRLAASGRSGRALRRRDTLALLCGAAAWPLAARAQQKAMPIIGYVADVPNEPRMIGALRAGLQEQGFVEGRDVVIDSHVVLGQSDRVASIVAELVRRRVAVIVTEGSHRTLDAAHAATSTIPIDAFFGGDPVAGGFVASLNRPGGNVTGVALFTGSANRLDLKRLDLLRSMVPGLRAVGVLTGPDQPMSEADRELETAAMAAEGIALKTAHVTAESDLEAGFAALVKQNVGAVLGSASAFLTGHRADLVALAARYRMPASWQWPEFVALGGLMSYGPSILDAAHQQGVDAGRILKGEKPADLPVVLPSIYHLAINLMTAKALGLVVPPTLLATADEVIE